ncbi:MAG: right-handed parallel beta-helix repeat-containing protein [Planctomycetia bacterium]|nr:right-handed parallel beta-helix repeat-containing protein [Planctomycetia bacterium]
MNDTAIQGRGEGSSQRDERAGISQAGDSIGGLSESGLPSPVPNQRRLIVALEGPADFRSIQAAINAATPGDVVVVKPGIYRQRLLLEKSLDMLGDGPASDIIVECDDKSCLTVNADSASVNGLSFRLTKKDYIASAIKVINGDARIEDCIIVGGCNIEGDFLAPKAVLINCQFQGTHGRPGVLVKQMGRATIQNCKFRGGDASGILVRLKGEATIEGCDICENNLGITICEEGKATIRNCQIRGSSDNGVLVKLNGEATIEGCDIAQNKTSGVVVAEKSEVTIKNCQVYDNHQVGTLVNMHSKATIQNCQIHDNYQAVSIQLFCTAAINNCEIHNYRRNGVIIASYSHATITDCNIYGNEEHGVLARSARIKVVDLLGLPQGSRRSSRLFAFCLVGFL